MSDIKVEAAAASAEPDWTAQMVAEALPTGEREDATVMAAEADIDRSSFDRYVRTWPLEAVLLSAAAGMAGGPVHRLPPVASAGAPCATTTNKRSRGPVRDQVLFISKVYPLITRRLRK
jgi:hypothetical protein